MHPLFRSLHIIVYLRILFFFLFIFLLNLISLLAAAFAFAIIKRIHILLVSWCHSLLLSKIFFLSSSFHFIISSHVSSKMIFLRARTFTYDDQFLFFFLLFCFSVSFDHHICHQHRFVMNWSECTDWFALSFQLKTFHCTNMHCHSSKDIYTRKSSIICFLFLLIFMSWGGISTRNWGLLSTGNNGVHYKW